MPLSDELRAQIDHAVRTEPVLLFMKGSRAFPQCGFSSSVVQILDEHLDHYRTVDVLADPAVRDGIKEYSDWPTIPQLFVAGEFLGGADIVRQMNEDGELRDALAGAKAQVKDDRVPTISFTDNAKAAIEEAARQTDDGSHLRLEVSPDFEHALSFSNPGLADVVLAPSGIPLVLDPESAARADGVSIDFVERDDGAGFKIENPQGKKAREATPDEDKAKRDAPIATAPLERTEPPSFDVTQAAREMFVGALAAEKEETGEAHVIQVTAKRMGPTRAEYALNVVTPKEAGKDDFHVEQDGVAFVVDRRSARFLDGAVIDFVEGASGAGFKFDNPTLKDGWSDPVAQRFQKLLDDEINPSVAAHGGYVELLDLAGNTAFVLMGGGCQGCGMASVTLQQGIRERVSKEIPEVERIVDTTDHASGTNPYYQAS